MSQYSDSSISPEIKRQMREDEQLKRLARLLKEDLLEQVSSFSYRDRLCLEKVSEAEDARMDSWRSSLSAPLRDLKFLIQLLNAERPDKQKLALVCDQLEFTGDISLLSDIFSEGKRVGISELMSQKGKTKRKKNVAKKAEMGIRWLQLEQEDPKKYSRKKAVAEKLSEEFNLDADYLKHLMTGPKDKNRVFFPDGLENAMKSIGL